MDFEKMMKSDMDDVAKRVEAGLETVEAKDGLTAEEVEKIVKAVVKEELAAAMNEIKQYISTVIIESQKSDQSNIQSPKIVSDNVVEPNIECSLKVTYDVKRALYGKMTCGGWTFGKNEMEGNHLWAVNDDGTKYYELYPKTISSVYKIEDGYVYFNDCDYDDFRVCISDGRVEKVED